MGNYINVWPDLALAMTLYTEKKPHEGSWPMKRAYPAPRLPLSMCLSLWSGSAGEAAPKACKQAEKSGDDGGK